MKRNLAVLKFELENYFKNKTYIITTILIAVAVAIGMSVPTIMNKIKNSSDKEDKTSIVLYDKNSVLGDMNQFKEVFPDVEWSTLNSYDEVKEKIESGEAQSGFVVNSLDDYTYVVKNNSITDNNEVKFKSILSQLYRDSYFAEKGLDVLEIENIINTQINGNIEILGKDSVNNYLYTYIFIFVLYMMFIMYGQLIAVSVTTEKSNRTMEVLVTSTSSNSLIFGKVIAGTIASFVQVAIVFTSAFISFNLNKSSLGIDISSYLDVPTNVIVAFAVFGTIGFVFYAFIFGALGALVSKTEDVSKSITPITMIFVLLFMGVFMNLSNCDGTVMKVLSFIPFSSCIAMFVRIAMGSVSTIEIVASLAILIVSTGFVGYIGAKIYRAATLMYGNPITLKNAFGLIKKDK